VIPPFDPLQRFPLPDLHPEMFFRHLDGFEYLLPRFHQFGVEVAAVAFEAAEQFTDAFQFQIHGLFDDLPDAVAVAVFTYVFNDTDQLGIFQFVLQFAFG